ncbi:MAG: metallophosphoesterase, partial [Firmicutes bacterium]|nr:metallophosphoesterase [Bacillota bacterium]
QHIFIFGHKPPVSPFRSGGPDTVSNLSATYGSSWGDPKAAAEFLKLASYYKVDAVFSGHIHMYNRLDVQGVPYFITAGAGASLYAPPEKGGCYHYLRCNVDGKKVSFEVVKISVNG